MKEFLKDFIGSFYALFSIIWFFSGILFVMRTRKEVGLKTTGEKIQYYLYGIGSSMLIGWIVCEICLYLSLSVSLAGALGGLAGYIGASTISSILLELFKNRVGTNDKSDK